MQSTYLQAIVNAALAEDLGSGDVTTNSLIPAQAQSQARFIFKSPGVLCGLNVVEAVFKALSPKISFKMLFNEGSRIKKGQVVAIVKGPARAILTGERVALNFLTHLSSIASNTKAFVDQVKPYPAQILDTRKTTPLLRVLERYAVTIGGGVNHRFDLSEMAMIKDNHRAMISQGDLKRAVKIVKDKTNKKVIVEVDTFLELESALRSQAEIILLDNMTPAQVHKAVVLRNKINPKILLEASGGIRLNNVRSYAKAGVERISIGQLTALKGGLDISLDFI